MQLRHILRPLGIFWQDFREPEEHTHDVTEYFIRTWLTQKGESHWLNAMEHDDKGIEELRSAAFHDAEIGMPNMTKSKNLVKNIEDSSRRSQT
jgi:hypothetical protein